MNRFAFSWGGGRLLIKVVERNEKGNWKICRTTIEKEKGNTDEIVRKNSE